MRGKVVYIASYTFSILRGMSCVSTSKEIECFDYDDFLRLLSLSFAEWTLFDFTSMLFLRAILYT